MLGGKGGRGNIGEWAQIGGNTEAGVTVPGEEKDEKLRGSLGAPGQLQAWI